jgi:hypothetical protein
MNSMGNEVALKNLFQYPKLRQLIRQFRCHLDVYTHCSLKLWDMDN